MALPVGSIVEVQHGHWAGLRGRVINHTQVHYANNPPTEVWTGNGLKRTKIKHSAKITNWKTDRALKLENGEYTVAPMSDLKIIPKNSKRHCVI